MACYTYKNNKYTSREKLESFLIEEQIQFQKALNKVGIDLVVNGFVYKNDVYLNSDQATNETSIHEFSHLYNYWLKQNKKELYNRGIELVQQEIGLRGINYQMQYPNRNKIIYVSTDKLLERFSKDDPNYDIQNEKNKIGGRLEKAKEFLQKYVTDSRYIDPRTGERTNTNVSFETSVVGIYDGRLGFTDGRHRVLAAKELGYKEVAIEIPTDQEGLFNDLLSKPSEIQDIIDYVKTTQPDLKGEALLEEILTELTGRRGAELLEAQKAKKGGIIDWLKDVWNEIANMLGLSSMTPQQVANLTLGQYADAVGVDLLKGNNLKEDETKFRDRKRWNPSRGSQTLEGAPIIKGRKNVTGADPELTYWAEEYARRNGIDYKRQSKYVEVDEDRAKRIAQAYEDMKHDPQDPKVKEAYQNLITQTKAQYDVLVEAGYKFYFYDETNDPYNGSPWAAMEDLRNNKTMAVFATEAGYGSSGEDLNVADNPMLQETGLEWSYSSLNGEKKRVLANDLFRAVHDAFGHGLEGAGFRAQGEENAWQAHARLFTGSAVAAITSETRGQNSWLNYGKYGEKNRTASLEETIFADQKTGLMPEWTWNEGFDKGRVDISPENSTNYANLTEDNEGNFVFYHVGSKGYETIKKGTGQNKATSREEASAVNRVGGLAMYYPAENVGETMVTGDTKYMVKIPKERVYDFNSDVLNLLPKAEKLFRKSYPNQAFDKNSQLAFTTKVAVEEGFDMVVARWDNTTRVQTVKEFNPEDNQTFEGNTIVKDFKPENKFTSNKDRGWKTQLPVTKKEKLKEVYAEIYREVNSNNDYSNPLYRVEESLEYSFDDKFAPFKSQEEITDLVENSTLPNDIKQRYKEAVASQDQAGYSFISFQKAPKKITVEDVLSYANSSERELTTEEKIDLQDVIMSLGLDNSYEALNRLEEALENKGVISFNKQRMLSSGVFNVLEVDKILNSEELQNNIKEAYKALKNTPLMEVSYPRESVYAESTELNSFGKQKVKNPYLYEQEVLVNQEVPQGAKPLNITEGTKVAKVKTINEQGELVNKTDGSDTKAVLEAVVISEENQKLADNLVLITQGISANVWNSNKEAVAKVVREIKNDAKNNGIDLKNIEEKVFTKSREEIIDFFDSMENFLETENAEDFAPIYNEMFDLNTEQTQVVKTDSNLDVVLEDNITEYEAFKNFNLVKKAPNVYRKVKDMSLEEVYNVSAINQETTVEELQKRIQSKPLDVVEFEVDAETLEKMQLWKEHLGFSKNIPQQMKEVSETIKEDNKWLLKSESPYFKITPYGLEAVSNDPLTLERAEMIRPKKEEVEDLIQLDINKSRRIEALKNPLSVEKLKSDHLYLKDVLAVRNETADFVRTPKGVFEMINTSGNVSFYSRVISEEKNEVMEDFSEYAYLETKPEDFSKAKNYYSKKELADINNENFDCN
jgi:hypothetical protein